MNKMNERFQPYSLGPSIQGASFFRHAVGKKSESLKSWKAIRRCPLKTSTAGEHQKTGAKLIKSAQQKHRNVINNDGGFFSVINLPLNCKHSLAACCTFCVMIHNGDGYKSTGIKCLFKTYKLIYLAFNSNLLAIMFRHFNFSAIKSNSSDHIVSFAIVSIQFQTNQLYQIRL